MSLSVTVGGARATFASPLANEVAVVLDRAFGGEGEWERDDSCHFGEMAGTSRWEEFQARAAGELGRDEVPNILAIGGDGRGAYLPAHVGAVSLPLSGGQALRCASLPGLRRELAELAGRWGLPLDDQGLRDILRVDLDPDDGFVADDPTVLTFARLALAANEAVRRDCPLWLVDRPGED
ncbi:MAG: hypothetical protein U0800_10230 [Isosphaeraceae bacterium]